MGEWVDVFFRIIQMTTKSVPSGFGLFIVEESWRVTLTVLFESEPWNNVWFHSFTNELLRSPFRLEVIDGVIPSLSRVSIEFPTVSLVRGSPVWHSETLEQGSWSSVEVHISDSFEEGFWMEVLGIDVVLNHWLLVEFIHIEVFNSEAYIILNLKLGQDGELWSYLLL